MRPCPRFLLQEKRVLEYVALGDFQTAVGFLLASPPDRSQRYYRDALCVLGMAFACGIQAAGASASVAAAAASAAEDAAARSLFVQAAKVITANAASVGDTLLGVPLLCSTGAHLRGSVGPAALGRGMPVSLLCCLCSQGNSCAPGEPGVLPMPHPTPPHPVPHPRPPWNPTPCHRISSDALHLQLRKTLLSYPITRFTQLPVP